MTLRSSVSAAGWMKLTDAARFLDVSEITLRRRIKAGQIPCEFKNGKYFVYVSEDERDLPDPRDPFEAPLSRPTHPKPSNRMIPSPSTQWDSDDLGESNFDSRSRAPRPAHRPRPTTPSQPSASPRASGQPTAPPYQNSLQRAHAQHLAQRDWGLEIQELRRMIEDQQSLIALLEETVEMLQEKVLALSGGRTKFQ